ncbi:MAG: outer membrane lipoprotein carrier protein LolA [Paracoccaceae bacterium]
MRYVRPIPAFLALLLALFASHSPAVAAPIPLADLSTYLSGLGTAEAEFTQINSDGSGSKGKVFIERPGRMRFEYAKPDKTLVLASGGAVAIFDAKSNQPPEEYPLKRTPLNLILGRRVNLETAKMVVGHREEGALTLVLAQDPEHPEYGTLEMGFAANPVRLTQWVVTDGAGAQTIVLLEKMIEGKRYPSSMFSIPLERNKHKSP